MYTTNKERDDLLTAFISPRQVPSLEIRENKGKYSSTRLDVERVYNAYQSTEELREKVRKQLTFSLLPNLLISTDGVVLEKLEWENGTYQPCNQKEVIKDAPKCSEISASICGVVRRNFKSSNCLVVVCASGVYVMMCREGGESIRVGGELFGPYVPIWIIPNITDLTYCAILPPEKKQVQERVRTLGGLVELPKVLLELVIWFC